LKYCIFSSSIFGQEEAHPGKGGVGGIFDIIVQATPGGDAGGRPVGEAAARVAFTYPEGEREEQGSVIQIYICGII
jgi:hypothetical protein